MQHLFSYTDVTNEIASFLSLPDEISLGVLCRTTLPILKRAYRISPNVRLDQYKSHLWGGRLCSLQLYRQFWTKQNWMATMNNLLPTLKGFHTTSCNLPWEAMELLASSKKFASLETLILENTVNLDIYRQVDVRGTCSWVMRVVQSHRSMRTFSIMDNQMLLLSSATIALLTWPGLESLNISGNYLYPIETPVQPGAKLVTLGMQNEHIKYVANTFSLQNLRIDQCPLHRVDYVDIFLNHHSLRSLSIRGGSLYDTFMRVASRDLHTLDLTSCIVDEDILADIWVWAPLSLRVFHMGCCLSKEVNNTTVPMTPRRVMRVLTGSWVPSKFQAVQVAGLQELRLLYTKNWDFQPWIDRNASSLRVVDISHATYLNPYPLGVSLVKCKILEELRASQCAEPGLEEMLQGMGSVDRLNRLRVALLDSMSSSPASKRLILKFILSCPSTRYLRLGRQNILLTPSMLHTMGNVAVWDMKDSHLTSVDFKNAMYLISKNTLPRLKELYIDNNPHVDDTGILTLGMWTRGPSLRIFSCRNTCIGVNGIMAIIELMAKQLRILRVLGDYSRCDEGGDLVMRLSMWMPPSFPEQIVVPAQTRVFPEHVRLLEERGCVIVFE